MGLYTAHWQAYARWQRRGTFVLLGVIAIGLPATALASFAVEAITGLYPVWLHLGLLVAWLIVFTHTLIAYSKVTCPRCASAYSRGRGLCDCPSCGLRMLQDDP